MNYIYTTVQYSGNKEFCVGGSKAKTVLYFPYSTMRCEQYNNRTGYEYGKEPEGFPTEFLSRYSDG